MRARDYVFRVAPRALVYEAARRGALASARPLTLTYSVTAACQSRCLTCHIGTRYLEQPSLAKANLTLDEIGRTFASLGPVYFFNVSGGEPFMRPDLDQVVRLACEHLQPRLIHIPTNAIAPRHIARTTRLILQHMDELLPAWVPISIKPSIDGVGAEHDRVRGFRGNFAKLEQTIDELLAIRREHPRLHVDLGTVISNHNLDRLDEIEDWVHARGIESYRHEIAEQRSEFHNLGDPITPSTEVYERLVRRFSAKIRRNLRGKAALTRLTEAVRLVYYEVAIEILREGRQVSPCYAGLSNIHLNYDGTLWPCCVLGDTRALGNVRDADYDVRRVLASEQARAARKFIADGGCACPLANQWLTNVLLTPRHMLRVVRTIVGQIAGALSRAGDVPADASVDVGAPASRDPLVADRYGAVPRARAVSLRVVQ